MALRVNINDFAQANPIYIGATVTFYTIDGSGVKTSTKATLYDAATGSGTIANPVTLDSEGKFSQPVYIETAVIATISGLTIADHDTGIIAVIGKWRGDWATATIYYAGEFVRAGVSADGTNDILQVQSTHTSGTFATDVSGGKLTVILDVSTFSAIDATLQTIADLVTVADRGIYFTASDVAALFTLTAAGRALLDDANAAAQRATLGSTAVGDALFIAASAAAARATLGSTAVGDALFIAATAAAARTTMGLTIGTDVQAYGATLTSLEALALVSGDILYATAADTLARLAKGTDGQYLSLVSGLPNWTAVPAVMTLLAEVATTSGSSVSLSTAIPSTAKFLIVHFKGVSVTANAVTLGIQIGDAGGLEVAGYEGTNISQAGAVTNTAMSSSFLAHFSMTAASTYHGVAVISLENAAAFSWACMGMIGTSSTTNDMNYYTGGKSLSAALDRVSVITSGTFDAGAVSLSYI